MSDFMKGWTLEVEDAGTTARFVFKRRAKDAKPVTVVLPLSEADREQLDESPDAYAKKYRQVAQERAESLIPESVREAVA